jgi:hypothetical protein
MADTKLETLLEELLQLNSQVVDRLDRLLGEVESLRATVEEEFTWDDDSLEKYTFAQGVMDRLDRIADALESADGESAGEEYPALGDVSQTLDAIHDLILEGTDTIVNTIHDTSRALTDAIEGMATPN